MRLYFVIGFEGDGGSLKMFVTADSSGQARELWAEFWEKDEDDADACFERVIELPDPRHDPEVFVAPGVWPWP